MNITYADGFGILSSLTDVKLDFALTQPQINQEGVIVANAQTVEQRIILSLPLAKSLAYKLQKTIEEYETKFGTVLNMDEIIERHS